ncbi:hypothetical protein E4T56_gene1910, partial [Termitomyces sp. T112]
MAARIDIGHGEARPADEFDLAQMRGQRFHHAIIGAKTHAHLLPLIGFKPHRARGDRLFKRPGGKEHPAVLGRPFLLRRGQYAARFHLGQIGADGRGFCHRIIAMLAVMHQRGQFPQAVGRQQGRRLGAAIFDDHLLVIGANFMQRPAGDLTARHRIGEKRIAGHGSSPGEHVWNNIPKDTGFKPVSVPPEQMQPLADPHRPAAGQHRSMRRIEITHADVMVPSAGRHMGR